MTKESIAEYHGTGKQLPKEHLPLIAVPTTAGTGSEVTKVSVVTNHAIGKKAPINCLNFYPTLAVIDPELTYSCPPKVTAGCGIDVLCHAVEGFWSKNHQPICDAVALHACFRDMNVMADEIHALTARLGLRNGLKDLNLNEEQIADLVRISVHPNLRNNPVYITDEMLDEMYHYLATQN